MLLTKTELEDGRYRITKSFKNGQSQIIIEFNSDGNKDGYYKTFSPIDDEKVFEIETKVYLNGIQKCREDYQFQNSPFWNIAEHPSHLLRWNNLTHTPRYACWEYNDKIIKMWWNSDGELQAKYEKTSDNVLTFEGPQTDTITFDSFPDC